MNLLKLLLSTAVLLASLATSYGQNLPSGNTSSQSNDGNWTASFDTETRIYSWRSDRAFPTSLTGTTGSATGLQVYVPYGLEIDGKPNDDLKIENSIRSGYVSSRQSAVGASGSFNGSVDTSLSTTMTYYGFNGIQPFASLNVNAPTGTTNLQGSAGNALLDSDVVDTPVFGQGWNFGPVLGTNFPLQKNLLVSLSVGYTSQGPFQRAAPFVLGQPPGLTSRVHPGDDITLTANFKYKTGSWKFGGSLTYLMESQQTIDNVAQSRSGNRTTASGDATYFWNDDWSTKLTATVTHQNRNWNFVVGAADLVPEAANSNSNVATFVLKSTYSSGPWSVGPTSTFMFRDHNSYDPINNTFMPQKTKFSVGGFGSYDVSKQISFNGRVERMWLNENTNPGLAAGAGPIPGFLSSAWVFVLGGTANF